MTPCLTCPIATWCIRLGEGCWPTSVTPVDAAADRMPERRHYPQNDAEHDKHPTDGGEQVEPRYQVADDQQDYSENDHLLSIFDDQLFADDMCRPITRKRRASTWRIRTVISVEGYL